MRPTVLAGMVLSGTVLAGAVLLAAAAWKAWLVVADVVPFNADEAVVALMARHILGGARPTFFYGQAYMGSLDAYLVAAGFAVFGEQVWVIRAVQALLYLGTIAVTMQMGRVALDSAPAGVLAGVLLAFPAVNTTLYTTASLGGYGEALLIGNLILLLSFWLAKRGWPEKRPSAPWALLGWGLLAGCGLWANGLTLVYTAPAAVYLAWAAWKGGERRSLWRWTALAGVGFLLGALPWWLYAAQHGPADLVRELLGSAVAVEREPWLARAGTHLVSFVLLGTTALFGLRPPWTVAWLALPLLPVVLTFWVGAILHLARRARSGSPGRAEWRLLAGVLLTLTAGFVFTSFGADPSGRYFLPMITPLALAAGSMVWSLRRVKALPWLAVSLVTAASVWGTVQCARQVPPGLTTQFYEPSMIDTRYTDDLIQFLKSQGETRGYTNYWVAYPLAFRSGEALLFLPRLPYHPDLRYTPRDDRYAPYRELVDTSERVAYITTRNPALDRALAAAFRAQGVTWQEKQIGDYHVYYNLSKPIRPQQVGLGEARK